MRETQRICLFAALSIAVALLAGGCDDSKATASGVTAESATPKSMASAPASAGSLVSAPASSDPQPEPSMSASPGASAEAVSSSEPVTSATASSEPMLVTPPKQRNPLVPSLPRVSTPASSGSAVVQIPPPAVSLEAPAPAAPGSADAVADKVDTIYLPIQRFRARFEQKYTAKIAGTTKNSDGVCYVKRPGKISFSYHKPNKNRVVSDGVTLKIYEAENQQMFVRQVATTEYPGALAFIMGKGLRHSFTFTFNESAKWEGGPVLVGTPRVPNPGYEKVLFYIDEELLKKGDPACVRRVLVIDAQGNRNRFDFIHVEQPEAIADGEFEFEAPAGTNIVK